MNFLDPSTLHRNNLRIEGGFPHFLDVFDKFDKLNTPPKTNMELENHSFEKENHLPNPYFGVPC